ncbi:MAG: hypothetical protein RJQ09_09935 [Cyclobacteriaceae bacterium]
MRLTVIIFLTCVFACQNPNETINESTQGTAQESSIFQNVTLNTNAPAETAQIGQLIGLWNCVSKDLVDSVWYENKALWKWEYTLGGHAVLNHWWQEDNSLNAPTLEYFANGIFIFNKDAKSWEAVILNSRPHKISPKFQLDYVDKEIRMHDGRGTWLVSFFNIAKDAFDWKYEIKKADGTWGKISEISAVRKVE